MPPYAEVIGDPIAHSKSPAIHNHWLSELGLDGEFRATRVAPDELAEFFAERRADPEWRGCNATAPHKEMIFPHVDEVAAEARTIGAINCVRRDGDRLIGLNTDVDGIAEALAGASLRGGRAVIVGGGGGARAALNYLVGREIGTVTILVRDPDKPAALARLGGPLSRVETAPFAQAEAAIEDAAVVINASPLGMAHADPTPAPVLAALARAAPGFTAFDMVYQPLDTPFLRAARAEGAVTVDGLRMLVGQARRAFLHFFGVEPPAEGDVELRRRLLEQSAS